MLVDYINDPEATNFHVISYGSYTVYFKEANKSVNPSLFCLLCVVFECFHSQFGIGLAGIGASRL